MICPNCHAEYFEKIKQCGDCIVDLVDASSLDLPIPEMTWVPLRPIHGSIYAEMIIEILNKEEIPHYAKNDWSSAALSTGGTELVNNIVRFMMKIFLGILISKRYLMIFQKDIINQSYVRDLDFWVLE